ncbi:hypothetical protein [Streptosporangium sp. NPDC049046]|uniref:hypothetical protein n=1 Tax=Streptosporangium sp. NPDC049046 TaxID=3155031 RepID=UPI00344A074E
MPEAADRCVELARLEGADVADAFEVEIVGVDGLAADGAESEFGEVLDADSAGVLAESVVGLEHRRADPGWLGALPVRAFWSSRIRYMARLGPVISWM